MGWIWDEVLLSVLASPLGLTTPMLVASTLASLLVTLNVCLHLSSRYCKRKSEGRLVSFGNFWTGSVALLSNKDSVLKREQVYESVQAYENLFHGARKMIGSLQKEESIKQREREYECLVNCFYNLVTGFYLFGWGQSFHFAPRLKGETWQESIKRAEYFLALRCRMGPSSKVLDVGCGVGGPMRNIHQFTGADITGVTINEYQVKVGNEYCRQMGIEDKCRIVQGDFQKLEECAAFEANAYDAAFCIESTCHSPDRVTVFSGINKSLKTNGYVCGYEWVVLPERGYDKNNPYHLRIKEGIEVGNGLPTLATADDIVMDLKKSGFEIVEAFDANQNAHSDKEIPWYETLNGSFTLSGFRMTRIGRISTHIFVSMFEFLGIAPKGTARVSALLNATAIDLVDGGKKEIFTPCYFFLARKK